MMSKEEIIELINSRIKYYTGGEAWKSLNESICDMLFYYIYLIYVLSHLMII